MLIYIFLVIEILLFNLLRKNKNITNKQYCKIIGISMILITGLRGVNVGSDTTVYYLNFNDLSDMSFAQLISEDMRDKGYYILAWAVNKWTGSFHILTLIAAITFYWPISKMIAEYSEDCGLSYLILLAFNFFQFSMTGIRQTMALGFAVLFIMEILREQTRFHLTVLWLVLGTLMHHSCLLMLIYYIIRLTRKSKKLMWGTVILIPILFLLRSQITVLLLALFDSIGFELSTYIGSGGGITTYLVYILLFVWGLFFTYKDDKQETGMPVEYMNIIGIATALQSFVVVNSIFFRVVWYFALFQIIFIPKLLTTSKVTEKSVGIMRFIIYIGILYMYLGITMSSANVVPYSFLE